MAFVDERVAVLARVLVRVLVEVLALVELLLVDAVPDELVLELDELELAEEPDAAAELDAPPFDRVSPARTLQTGQAPGP